MPLSDIYNTDKVALSFELFPPKTPVGDKNLYKNLAELMQFQPSYVTCTYGAGGSTQTKTLDIVSRVKKEFDMAVASHLTCVGATVDQLREYLSDAKTNGIDHIVALRGDPPHGETQFKQIEGGLQYANELVKLIREEFPSFGIAVAGYPETHQEAISVDADLENLKRKVDSGGQVVLTQLFYQNEDFFRFRERCEKIGITAPIVPGILPVTSLAQIQRITSLCGAKLPQEFVEQLEKEDEEGQFDVGVEFATAQVQQLIDQDAPGVHFYVLNKSQATGKLLSNISL